MTVQQASQRTAMPARIAICLQVGLIVTSAIFVAAGFMDSLRYVGPAASTETVARAIWRLTVWEWARLAGLSMALNLIACLPVYLSPAPARPALMVFCAALASAVLAGYFSIEAWYWFGDCVFPHPAVILTLAVSGLASAYASRTVLNLLRR
jgi:hypothetical protein